MLENRSDNIETEINEKSEELLKDNKYLPEEDRVVLSVKLKAFENDNKIFDSSYFLDEKEVVKILQWVNLYRLLYQLRLI